MTINVYGVGHALVDLQFAVEVDQLDSLGIEKGVMTLVDDAGRDAVLSALGDPIKSVSGGSAANTTITVSRFGGCSFYACQVGDDDWGRFYRRDLADAGVGSSNGAYRPGTTGQCLVMVTPDADRTMNTCLGVSTDMGPHQLSEERIAESQYVYLEGYLLTSAEGVAACDAAIDAARRHGAKVSLTLSDPAIVGTFKNRFRSVLRRGVDLLFCNEAEAEALTGSTETETVVAGIRDEADLVFITLGSKGVLIVDRKGSEKVEGYEVNAVDTTGAGDTFAGGVLYGLTHDLSPRYAAQLANYAASIVVSVLGSRLNLNLEDQISAILDGSAPPPSTLAAS
ncbi:MAG: adenosine kinase [Candidatus Latescibacterota bacterium]|nr:adenosine kinase [Candidatus Latescibacterota bacterium]